MSGAFKEKSQWEERDPTMRAGERSQAAWRRVAGSLSQESFPGEGAGFSQKDTEVRAPGPLSQGEESQSLFHQRKLQRERLGLEGRQDP